MMCRCRKGYGTTRVCAGSGISFARASALAALVRDTSVACLWLLRCPCRECGALPPPLAGEGWGGGMLARFPFMLAIRSSLCLPPPCPSPASGEGTLEPMACRQRELRPGNDRRKGAAHTRQAHRIQRVSHAKPHVHTHHVQEPNMPQRPSRKNPSPQPTRGNAMRSSACVVARSVVRSGSRSRRRWIVAAAVVAPHPPTPPASPAR